MRTSPCMLLLAICGLSHAQAESVESVRAQLVDVARDRLRPLGIVVDDSHAWLTLSAPIEDLSQYKIMSTWRAGAVPPLPLVFELTPIEAAPGERPVRAVLAISLQRPVLVASRRLRKGSAIGCHDTLPQLRDIKHVPSAALDVPCVLNARVDREVVARRDIAAGDVLRQSDAGDAPAVSSGETVQLQVRGNGIDVSTTAVALADASIGDRVDVRLAHPLRTLRTRVTDRHVVQLAEDQR